MTYRAIEFRLRLVVSVLFLAAPVSAGEALDHTQGGDGIIGAWRGSSLCVDRKALPACNDEEVVYEIVAKPGQSDAVTVKADKIVDGKRVPMGALDFVRDAKDGSWATNIETPSVHALWRLAVGGTTMTGTMTLLPSNVVVRRMDLKRSE